MWAPVFIQRIKNGLNYRCLQRSLIKKINNHLFIENHQHLKTLNELEITKNCINLIGHHQIYCSHEMSYECRKHKTIIQLLHYEKFMIIIMNLDWNFMPINVYDVLDSAKHKYCVYLGCFQPQRNGAPVQKCTAHT